jgi:hypothetical protein
MFSVIFEGLPNKENWDDYLDGTVNLLDHRRNEPPNRARHADNYAIPATLVTSAQI